jgi:hypothetical protein
MRKLNRLLICLAVLVCAAGVSAAADGKLMHCFYFTAVEGATDADWQAFYKATDALPGKIPGLLSVWYGKLSRPMSVFMPAPETRKQLKPDTTKITGEFSRVVRQHGVCMEFKDEAALKAYAPDPAHKEWEAIYGKVRQYGTTTFDILSAK